jgi:hypothetical protein
MALSNIGICDFGWKARDFAVKASIGRIVAEADALREIGIGTIAIMPNDTEAYRADSFDKMKAIRPKPPWQSGSRC